MNSSLFRYIYLPIMKLLQLSNPVSGPFKNACYANAGLHALSSSPQIFHHFSMRRYKTPGRNYPICDELARLFTYQETDAGTGPLREAVGVASGNREFYNGSQQDVVEFIRALFEGIAKEEHGSQAPFDNLIKGRMTLQREFVESNNGSCSKCGSFIEPETQDFNILSLPRRTCSKPNIQSLIEQVQEDMKMRCPNSLCSDLADKTVSQTRIYVQLPPVLFIQIAKEFHPTAVFNRQVNTVLTVQGVKYQLGGLVDHHGVSPDEGGHYIAWKKYNSQWYRCEDESIQVAGLNSLASSTNYLLVYHQEGNLTPPSQIIHQRQEVKEMNSFPSVKPQETKESEWQTVGKVTCKGCQKKFKRINTHLSSSTACKVFYETKSNEEMNSSLNSGSEVCRGCNREFKHLKQHLAYKTDCKKNYDEDELNQDSSKKAAERKRKERAKKSESQKKDELMENAQRRAKQTDEERQDELLKNAKRMKERREMQTDEEKKDELRKNAQRRAKQTEEERKDELLKNAKRMKERREMQTDEEKEDELRKNAKRRGEWRQQMKKDPNYNKTVAMKKRAQRARSHKSKNATIHKRRRNFNEATRYGPSFPCICCHRTCFDKAVIEIKDVAELREKLNRLQPTFFQEAIGDDLSKFPTRKGRHYLCQTCRNYIFDEKIPPMSNQNNLGSFDYRQAPELQLTEMESSMIAKQLIFMKAFKLPTSRMSGIKDRVVCVPVDEGTIQKTLECLPRTPNEAGLVPVKWKRRVKDKGNHLQEYVNVKKMFKALETLKKLGHPEYQFFKISEFNEFKEKCLSEDNPLHEDLFDDELG